MKMSFERGGPHPSLDAAAVYTQHSMPASECCIVQGRIRRIRMKAD